MLVWYKIPCKRSEEDWNMSEFSENLLLKLVQLLVSRMY